MSEVSPALYSLRIPFASNDALAQLNNTRTQLFGTDNARSLAEPMLTWPGTPDWKSLALFQTLRAEDDQGSKQPSQPQTDATGYDCATDKCANGKELSTIGAPFRRLNCALGFSNAGLCDQLPAPGEVTKHDGADSGVGATGPAFGDWLFGVTATDKETLIKRLALVLLAIVVIYAGVRSFN